MSDWLLKAINIKYEGAHGITLAEYEAYN